MPRIQTPTGYYTATEVTKLLNVSYAVVREYANNGRIKYVIPPGRKQGFYLKKDVDKIVNELTAFLSLNEDSENDGTTFTLASKEDLAEITKIAYTTFFPDRDIPPTAAWHLNAIEKNPYMDYVLKKDNKIIGYVSIVPFKEGNEKIYKCLEVETLSEIGITHDDIETFETNKRINLYIMAMATNPNLSVPDRRKYGYRLIARFTTQIVSLGAKGVIINKVIARGDTKQGVKLLQGFGFTEIIRRRKDSRAFSMDIETSGTPAAMQYKHALKESGVLDMLGESLV
jgi:hypothetical protein